VRFLILATMLAGFVQVHAQSANRINFKTKYDKFELLITNGNATIDGKPADTTTFRDLLPLLTKDLGEDCPTLRGSADVTVSVDGKPRMIYIQQGLVTDGKKCMYVSGDGLMYFPLHRSWLIDNGHDSLPFGSNVKVSVGGQTVLDIKRKGKKWVKVNDDDHPDWDFVEKFENDLKDFTVKMHANLAMSKDKREVIVDTNGKIARLFHVTPTLWALQKPGTQWLEVGDWSQWFELEPSQFSDHRIEKIRIILDKNKELQERLHELNEIDTGWSRSVHEMYIRLLSDREENPEIQKIALKRLHSKPTIETAGAMVAYLQFATDPALKKMATQALKIQNPKGRLIEAKQSPSQQMDIVQEWSRWWQKVQAAQ
jgi:hypothetical protein